MRCGTGVALFYSYHVYHFISPAPLFIYQQCRCFSYGRAAVPVCLAALPDTLLVLPRYETILQRCSQPHQSPQPSPLYIHNTDHSVTCDASTGATGPPRGSGLRSGGDSHIGIHRHEACGLCGPWSWRSCTGHARPILDVHHSCGHVSLLSRRPCDRIAPRVFHMHCPLQRHSLDTHTRRRKMTCRHDRKEVARALHDA